MQRSPLQISFYFLVLAFLFAMSILFSCSKDKGSAESIFYGQWKTSYGDTISFARMNGKNMMTRDNSMNPGLPMTSTTEYTYRNNKLGYKINPTGDNGFFMLDSFKWLEHGKSFEVQGIQWFMFLSSTMTYFTFTRIK